jgi:hypothetical protein
VLAHGKIGRGEAGRGGLIEAAAERNAEAGKEYPPNYSSDCNAQSAP